MKKITQRRYFAFKHAYTWTQWWLYQKHFKKENVDFIWTVPIEILRFIFSIIVCLLESFQITLNDEPHPPILQRGVSLTSAHKQRLCHIDSGLVMLKIN